MRNSSFKANDASRQNLLDGTEGSYQTSSRRTVSVESVVAAASGRPQLSWEAIIENPLTKPLCFWAVWMLSGTLFYRFVSGFPLGRAFFMAVNVGYCIGWDFPQTASSLELYFSVGYMFIGASAVAVALARFAQSMIENSKEWYAEALAAQNYNLSLAADRRRSANDVTCWQRASTIQRNVVRWCGANSGAVKVIIIWASWLFLFILVAYLMNPRWSFAQCLFFTFSSLVTSGLRDIPDSSPSWKFFILGIFAATGVPLTGLFMSFVANLLINVSDPKESEKKITARVTRKELEMMEHFDLEDGDGEISRAEYIVLCAVRLGALSPHLIEMINKRFHQLDVNNDGVLSYREITQTNPVRTSLIALRMIGMMKSAVRKRSLMNALASASESAAPSADSTDLESGGGAQLSPISPSPAPNDPKLLMAKRAARGFFDYSTPAVHQAPTAIDPSDAVIDTSATGAVMDNKMTSQGESSDGLKSTETRESQTRVTPTRSGGGGTKRERSTSPRAAARSRDSTGSSKPYPSSKAMDPAPSISSTVRKSGTDAVSRTLGTSSSRDGSNSKRGAGRKR